MGVPDGLEGLCLACECVSAKREGYCDSWAAVAKNKLLVDGTKEGMLNLVAREPKTISQPAEALSLSAPSVHAHVGDMTRGELLRGAVEWEKSHPTGRYYEPNSPVVTADERAEFASLRDEMAERFAGLFSKRRARLERAFRKTTLAARFSLIGRLSFLTRG